MRIIPIAILTIAVCAGCARIQLVTREEAITIAKNAAATNGYNIQEYELQWAEEHTPKIDNRPIWLVFFDGTNGVVGNHVSVVIDKQTREATVIPGE